MQKITIEPVTRIEGHAKVTMHLGAKGKVEKAFMHVNEWRGFEKFTEGRPFFEMLQITPRICGICPVSHHLASAKACDQIVGVTPPRTALLLRELMHMGQFIQSHSMHFFELAGPDMLLGFDADPAIRNVVGVIQANPELALKAVQSRTFGQDIIRKLGTKSIHPIHSIPGGVNAPLQAEDCDDLLSRIDDIVEIIKIALTVAKGWFENNRELVDQYAVFPSGYMGLVDEEGGLQLYEGKIRLADKTGKILEQFEPKDYLEVIAEHVEDWSFLKFPYYRKMG
ncbi:MAG: Ni/Fe hydrogenase subunit alpha [Thermodesulfobacteriota bacterium]